MKWMVMVFETFCRGCEVDLSVEKAEKEFSTHDVFAALMVGC
jgi:hypothetical protein